MTHDEPTPTVDDRAALAEAFDTRLDPLAKYAATFESVDADPFGVFLNETLPQKNPAPKTVVEHERLIRLWQTHMNRVGRHPACPNEGHVESFVTHLCTERDNQRDTAGTKLRRLDGIYESWQADPVFPHPDDYNPFTRVLSKLDLGRPEQKQPPRLPIPELRTIIDGVTHLRDRLVIVLQLKLGLRASELGNIELPDLHLDAPYVQDTYPTLGTHPAVENRPNAVYIPPRTERAGNKSFRPRVLPIDAELQSLLRRYLLVRPHADTDAVMLTTSTHNPLTSEAINRIWKEVFRPEYDESETHRAITSHFGRHRFTTYWRVEQDVSRALVKYMRGDRQADIAVHGADSIDAYVHTYYEDIEPVYRQQMFQLLE